MRVHLVDGTYELFRYYFGGPKIQGPNGMEVGAVRGLLRTLDKLIREEDVTHIAVAFDHIIESFRNRIFDGYKTSEGIETELMSQFPLAERAVHALGITTWPMVDFEADDALATGAAQLSSDPNVDQVVLCSPDKDLAQCVQGTRVVLYDRMRKRTYCWDEVIKKFGVEPPSIPDWLALVGDSADGIPGIPRWGAKSSAAVLRHYLHIEQIPEDPAVWEVYVRGKSTLAENLNKMRGEALLYRRLATLRTDVPIGTDLKDLQWSGPRTDALATLCMELGDQRFLERIH
jgi:5'-3' exonuclease